MHGLIFTELRKYITIKLGKDVWNVLLKNAGLEAKAFMPFDAYADNDMMALVATASAITDKSASDILQDFGEFIAPDLLFMYQGIVQPQWRTLDVIEHTESTIHTIVREKNPTAQPPQIVCERPQPNEIVITYSSARQMCAVAKGIITGLAKYYREELIITESKCMLEGDSACIITVKVIGEYKPHIS
jgi:predicted hydrocarbon binding protein